jgi:hypothetical protein
MERRGPQLAGMAQRQDLIPPAVRIAVRNAVGGSGPYSVREIEDLFNSHEFTDRNPDVPDSVGERRTEVEAFHSRIDWTSREQAQRYLDLVTDVLDRYPEGDDEPGSPGRVLRRALDRGGFVTPDGRLVVPGRPEPVEPDIGGIWIPDRPRIFMSHVSTAREPVSQVAQGLETFQCSCFVAHTQIEPSRDWQDTIEVALQTCHALVAWVTPNFPRSNWTDQEVGWVLGRGIPVVPVNAGLQPYGFFGAKQSLPADSWVWNTAFPIFEAFVVPALRPQPPPGSVEASLVARTVVRAFCESPSYDSTRQRFPLLRRIPPPLWTSEMFEELEAAAQSNRQISEAGLTRPSIEAPEAVRQLIDSLRSGGGVPP